MSTATPPKTHEETTAAAPCIQSANVGNTEAASMALEGQETPNCANVQRWRHIVACVQAFAGIEPAYSWLKQVQDQLGVAVVSWLLWYQSDPIQCVHTAGVVLLSVFI